jgi:hypothetical protein
VDLFFGAVFDSKSVHCQKIESFKKRFDPKHRSSFPLQLSLLPPFKIDFKHPDEFKEFLLALEDIIEDHLIGGPDSFQLEFNGITFHTGKKEILGLTPKISYDFEHLKESIYEYLKGEGVRFKRPSGPKIFLPIGRFENNFQLEAAVEMAKIEFSGPFVLDITEIALFEKNLFEWNYRANLAKFKKGQNGEFLEKLWAN